MPPDLPSEQRAMRVGVTTSPGPGAREAPPGHLLTRCHPSARLPWIRPKEEFASPRAQPALWGLRTRAQRPVSRGAPPRSAGAAARPCTHGARDDGGGLRGSVAQCAVVEMGVDRGGLALAVSEQPSHRAQSDAVHHSLGSPGVPAVVDAHIVEPGETAQLLPAQAEVLHRAVARPVREDEPPLARQAVEDGPCGRRKLDRLRPGFAIGQDGAGAAYPVPPEPGDLGGSRTGEQQQPDRGGGPPVVGVVEHEAEALQLVQREEAFARGRFVPPHVAAGVRALGTKVPQLGLPHHDRKHRQGPVGVARRAAHRVEPAPHIGAGDPQDTHRAEEGNEVAAAQMTVAFLCGRLPPAPLAAHEVLGGIGEQRAGLALGVRGCDRCESLLSRLGGGHLVRRAEDDVLRAELVHDADEEGLRAARENPEVELRQVDVIDGKAARTGFVFPEGAPQRALVDGRVDGHGRVSVVCSLGRRPFQGNRGGGFGETTRPARGIATVG